MLFALITAGAEPADKITKGAIFGSAFRQFVDSNVFGGLLLRAAAPLIWSTSARNLAYHDLFETSLAVGISGLSAIAERLRGDQRRPEGRQLER